MYPNLNPECKTCQRGVFQSKTKLLVISFFVFLTSVYGIYRLIKDISLYLFN